MLEVFLEFPHWNVEFSGHSLKGLQVFERINADLRAEILVGLKHVIGKTGRRELINH